MNGAPVQLNSSLTTDIPDLITVMAGKSDHRQASWFSLVPVSRKQVVSALNGEPDGSFRVYEDVEGGMHLAYVYGGQVLEEGVNVDADMAKLQRESLTFFSLSTLIAYHYYERGILHCLLSPSSANQLIRSVYLTASGLPHLTARSRVDPAAASALYYLGGVPEEVAIDALDGAFDGAFVICDSLSDMQMLWLHFIEQGFCYRCR